MHIKDRPPLLTALLHLRNLFRLRTPLAGLTFPRHVLPTRKSLVSEMSMKLRVPKPVGQEGCHSQTQQ